MKPDLFYFLSLFLVLLLTLSTCFIDASYDLVISDCVSGVVLVQNVNLSNLIIMDSSSNNNFTGCAFSFFNIHASKIVFNSTLVSCSVTIQNATSNDPSNPRFIEFTSPLLYSNQISIKNIFHDVYAPLAVSSSSLHLAAIFFSGKIQHSVSSMIFENVTMS